jgi:DNA replication protein DnaC
MDHLPEDEAPAAQPVRPMHGAEKQVECPEHGQFTSRNFMGRIWSRCPACTQAAEAEAEAQRQREAAELAARRHAGMLSSSRIPLRFHGRSFENFEADTDAKRHALTVARDFAERFSEMSRKGSGLIFSGRPGTGKSHLAGAILQAVLSPDVRYATCMDLIRAVRETWRRDSEKSESQILTYFERLDLLVIDEVGMQYGTDGEQTILFDVLDRRYREVRPTILLTNQDKDGFAAFVGERTFDRLKETCRWVPFDWESYRPAARRAAA